MSSQLLAAALAGSIAVLPSIAVNDAAAQGQPNAKFGRSLAKRLCAACHVVAGERRLDSMLVEAPSFASIANKPGQSIEAIAGRIVIPHAEMPRIKLTRDEIAALATYIFSLHGKAP